MITGESRGSTPLAGPDGTAKCNEVAQLPPFYGLRREPRVESWKWKTISVFQLSIPDIG